MKKNYRLIADSAVRPLLMLLAVLLLSACEKVAIQAEDGAESEGETNVRLQVTQVEGMDGTSSTRVLTDVSEVCTRLNFLLYQNGKKVKTVNQKESDATFGLVDVSLDAGTYQLLVLAHSCAANPSSASPDKVQFNNTETGYTDTFYYYGDLTVGDEPSVANLALKRAVAMFRLMVNDAKPAGVQRLRIYYTGGSGALNAMTGYGYVKSQQYTMYEWPDGTGTPTCFDAYTFLHDETGNLNLTVTAYGADNAVVCERQFKDVSMRRNTITQYSGDFFANADDGGETPVTPDSPATDDPTDDVRGIKIQVDPEWSGVNEYSF